MKPPPISVVKLMVVVSVVAFDLAAARTFFAYDSEMLIGVALGGVLLQVGIVRLMRSRGPHRAFWGGFVVCGMMAIMSLVWAMLFLEVLGIRGGALIRTPGSPLHTIRYGYAEFVSERIVAPVLDDSRIKPGLDPDSVLGGLSIVAIRAVVWFLPQLLIAMVGGLLTGLIGRRPGKRTEGYPHVTSPIYS